MWHILQSHNRIVFIVSIFLLLTYTNAAGQSYTTFVISQNEDQVSITAIDVSTNTMERVSFNGTLADNIRLSDSEIIVIIKNDVRLDIKKISLSPMSVISNSIDGSYIESILTKDSLFVAAQNGSEVVIKRLNTDNLLASGTSMSGIFVKWFEKVDDKGSQLLILKNGNSTDIRKIDPESFTSITNSASGDFRDLLLTKEKDAVILITQDNNTISIRKIDLETFDASNNLAFGTYNRTLEDGRSIIIISITENSTNFKKININDLSSLSNSVEGRLIDASLFNNTIISLTQAENDLVFRTIRLEDMSSSGGTINDVGKTISVNTHIRGAKLHVVDSNGETITRTLVGQPLFIMNSITTEYISSDNYVSILQVTNSNNETISTSWISGKVAEDDNIEITRYWAPDVSGIYTIESFTWSSISDPMPIADPERIDIIVE